MEEQSESNHDVGNGSDTPGEGQEMDEKFSPGVAAEEDMTLTDSGAFGIAVGRDLQMSDSGAFSIAVGRDLTLNEGGALLMKIDGNAEITNGGAFAAVCNDVTARESSIGVLISRQTNLGEGANVMFDTRQAMAFGAAFGAVFGAVFALLSLFFRRRS